MRTPKEKAQELVSKFRPFMYPFGAGSAYLTGDRTDNNVLKDAKELARYMANEILQLFVEPHLGLMNSRYRSEQIGFWQQVLIEIDFVTEESTLPQTDK